MQSKALEKSIGTVLTKCLLSNALFHCSAKGVIDSWINFSYIFEKDDKTETSL